MKRHFVALLSFVATIIIGFSLPNELFRTKPIVFKQVESNEIKLATNISNEDAKKYYDEGVAYYCSPIPYDPIDYEQKQNQKFKSAVESFKQAIKLKPDYHEAYEYLGHSYDALKNYGLALEAYKEAARLKPDSWQAHFYIGQTYFAFHRYGEAITFYLKANDIYSNTLGESHVGIIQSLGRAYLERDDRESALEQYKILKKLCRKHDCRGIIDEFEYLLRK
jgi:tetratricopeptide (TPR) repeat protein